MQYKCHGSVTHTPSAALAEVDEIDAQIALLRFADHPERELSDWKAEQVNDLSRSETNFSEVEAGKRRQFGRIVEA